MTKLVEHSIPVLNPTTGELTDKPHMLPKRRPGCESPREAVDTKPVALPVGFVRPPSLHEQIELFTGANRRRMLEETLESDEDADNFECEHDIPLPVARSEIEALKTDARTERRFLKRNKKPVQASQPSPSPSPTPTPSPAHAGPSGDGPLGQ